MKGGLPGAGGVRVAAAGPCPISSPASFAAGTDPALTTPATSGSIGIPSHPGPPTDATPPAAAGPARHPGHAVDRAAGGGRGAQGAAAGAGLTRDHARPGADQQRQQHLDAAVAHPRGAAELRLPGAPGAPAALHRGRPCPRSRPTAGSSRCASGRASSSPTTRPSAAARASWWRQDYVYAIKRFYDPRWNSSDLYLYESLKLPGLGELREQALKTRQPFDYDREVEGLRALDRYTLRITLGVPDPRFVYMLADPVVMGAVAREVVEHYGDDIGAHPVGTGPFRLKSAGGAARASCSSVARLPRRCLRRHAGRRARGAGRRRAPGRRTLPLVDEVVVDVVEEDAAALAVVPGRQPPLAGGAGRLPGAGRARAGSSRPTWRAAASAAAPGAPRHGDELLLHGAPAGGRLHARQGGAAARHRAGLRRRGLHPHVSAARACRRRAWCRLHQRLRPGLQERDERPRPGARARAARPATATSTATATAGASSPTAGRWC
jgi:hypothetical protein